MPINTINLNITTQHDDVQSVGGELEVMTEDDMMDVCGNCTSGD